MKGKKLVLKKDGTVALRGISKKYRNVLVEKKQEQKKINLQKLDEVLSQPTVTTKDLDGAINVPGSLLLGSINAKVRYKKDGTPDPRYLNKEQRAILKTARQAEELIKENSIKNLLNELATESDLLKVMEEVQKDRFSEKFPDGKKGKSTETDLDEFFADM